MLGLSELLAQPGEPAKSTGSRPTDHASTSPVPWVGLATGLSNTCRNHNHPDAACHQFARGRKRCGLRRITGADGPAYTCSYARTVWQAAVGVA